MIFDEELHLSSDFFQKETSIVLVKQFSDRQGIMERILPIDRVRNQDKSSNKNYLDNNLQLIFSDYNLQTNKQEPFGNLLFNSIINENFYNDISNSFDTFSKDIFIIYKYFIININNSFGARILPCYFILGQPYFFKKYKISSKFLLCRIPCFFCPINFKRISYFIFNITPPRFYH